jgi:hypothetical protein
MGQYGWNMDHYTRATHVGTEIIERFKKVRQNIVFIECYQICKTITHVRR